MHRRTKLPGLARKPSGAFIVRKRIPPGLRDAAKALHGVEHEWIEPLGTDAAAKAERAYPAALARIHVKQDQAERAARRQFGLPGDGVAAAPVGQGTGGRDHAANHPYRPPVAPPLDPAAVHRAMDAWEAAEIRRSASAILAGRVPHPHDGLAASQAWLDVAHRRSQEICYLGALDFVWDPPPSGTLTEIDRALVEALEPHGAKLEVGHPALRALRAPYRDARLRALRAESQMHLDWGEGRLPAPAARDLGGASRPFSELVDLYRGRRNPKEEDVAPLERRIIEAIGGDKPCGSVSKDDVIRCRDLLERIPAHPSREDERLPLPGLASKHEAGVRRWLRDATRRRAEAEHWDEDDDDGDDAEKSDRSAVRPLADQTIAKYLLILKSIFERGVEENWLPSNPTDGVAHPQRGVKLERVPYTDDDLRTLFGGPVHTGMASPQQRMVRGDVVVGNADYWLQLFGPLSGARLEEIGQALVTDIKVSDGIALLDVSTTDERGRVVKRLKSGHAARELPLHPKTLELGFLEYVAAVRAAGHTRLFPDLLVNRRKDGSPIFTRNYSSKRYPRYRAKLGIDDPRKPYHSYRHRAKAMMKRLGIEYAKQDAVLGHAPPTNAGSKYARGETLALRTKLEIISALWFPGLAEVKRPTTWGLSELDARPQRPVRNRADNGEGGSGTLR